MLCDSANERLALSFASAPLHSTDRPDGFGCGESRLPMPSIADIVWVSVK